MTQITDEQTARYAVFDAFSLIVRQGYRGHAAGSERFLTSLNAALDTFAAAVRQDARMKLPTAAILEEGQRQEVEGSARCGVSGTEPTPNLNKE